MNARREAPAARRNSSAILKVLLEILPETGTVLEIGSGTGQHACEFAIAIAPRKWLPSDTDPKQRASIGAWISCANGPKPLLPRSINAASMEWSVSPEDGITAIVAVNVVHITPWSVTQGLIKGAGKILPPSGILFLYGPFKRSGEHTSPSNAAFDTNLRAQNLEWGVRDLDEIEKLAVAAHLTLVNVIDMPSNNFSIVFKRM